MKKDYLITKEQAEILLDLIDYYIIDRDPHLNKPDLMRLWNSIAMDVDPDAYKLFCYQLEENKITKVC